MGPPYTGHNRSFSTELLLLLLDLLSYHEARSVSHLPPMPNLHTSIIAYYKSTRVGHRQLIWVLVSCAWSVALCRDQDTMAPWATVCLHRPPREQILLPYPPDLYITNDGSQINDWNGIAASQETKKTVCSVRARSVGGRLVLSKLKNQLIISRSSIRFHRPTPEEGKTSL